MSELWSKLWSDLWCADMTLETHFRLKVTLFMFDSTFVAKLQYRGSVKELGTETWKLCLVASASKDESVGCVRT